ncbi:28723_t:CDS:1, partial [Racocetra persica]
SNASDNNDSMLVIKVDNDEEESNKSKNRPKETFNIKIQQNNKLKEENKKNMNKKNQKIKRIRKKNVYKIRQLFLKQNCKRNMLFKQIIEHEYLLLNQENE